METGGVRNLEFAGESAPQKTTAIKKNSMVNDKEFVIPYQLLLGFSTSGCFL
jgi:hypothetical protein